MGRNRAKGGIQALIAGLLLGGVLASPVPAAASPFSALNKRWLTQNFASSRHTTAEQVVALRAYDLKQVRGLAGFVLGRHASKDGKRTYAGLVTFARHGARYRVASLGLGGAGRVRALSLVDLSARRTAIAPGAGGWLARHVPEPSSRARWPLLVVQTERMDDRHLTQELSLISLEDLTRPKTLLTLTTLSTTTGEVRRTRGPTPRFKGTRVTGLRLINEPGRPPRLEVTKKRISTRFDRCRAPRSTPAVYELEGGRFVMLPREGGPGGSGGCR